MTDTEYLTFNCLNPGCGKLIKMKRPGKSGIYAVTCPHCGMKKPLRFKGTEAAETPLGAPAAAAVSGSPHPADTPQPAPQPAPHPTPAPTSTQVAANLPAPPDTADRDCFNDFRGKLTLLRKGWLNKSFPIGIGRHLVGRHDPAAMSDISIRNDSGISRRSVEVKVEFGDHGYSFKLTVLKATNPVLLNDAPLSPGQSATLSFGDIITLGETRLRLDKDI